MSAPEKILIDSGPSERGWHRLEAFLRCPQFYYWKIVARNGDPKDPSTIVPLESSLPLVRGSIGHVGLAHYYSRMRALITGDDHRQFYTPDEAMSIVSKKYGETGEKILPIVKSAVHAYAERYAGESFEILGIEVPLRTDFFGHRYTARVDLVVREQDGKVWFWDHKFVSYVRDETFRRYTLSGQFLGMTWIGARSCWRGPNESEKARPVTPQYAAKVRPPGAVYPGEFGGVRLNVIGVGAARGEPTDSFRFVRRAPDPAPWMLQRFPIVVKEAEEQIYRLEHRKKMTPVGIEDGGMTPREEWPAAPSEMTCYTPYGECDYFDLCRWGS